MVPLILGVISGWQPPVQADGGAPLMHPDTSPSPLFLTRVRDRVYFAIHDELGGGWQLWRTDGTPDGTELVVRDLGSDLELTGFGDQVVFGVRGALWMSDGTVPGTRVVKHLPFFPTGLKGITGLKTMNDVVLFSDGNGGLWRSDGTEAGTTMVRHLDPRLPVHDLTPAGITKGEETIFFRAVGGDIGAELWRSDGTEAGTIPVVDLNAGGGSFPGYFRVFEKRLYFGADGGTGFEPWVSDGTPEGTISLGDLNSTGSSYARHFREAGDLIFFAADQGLGDGTELWRTDGTPQGTRRVLDINPNGGSLPNALVEMNGVLYFRADDGTHGSELWRSDGTAPGASSPISPRTAAPSHAACWQSATCSSSPPTTARPARSCGAPTGRLAAPGGSSTSTRQVARRRGICAHSGDGSSSAPATTAPGATSSPPPTVWPTTRSARAASSDCRCPRCRASTADSRSRSATSVPGPPARAPTRSRPSVVPCSSAPRTTRRVPSCGRATAPTSAPSWCTTCGRAATPRARTS